MKLIIAIITTTLAFSTTAFAGDDDDEKVCTYQYKHEAIGQKNTHIGNVMGQHTYEKYFDVNSVTPLLNTNGANGWEYDGAFSHTFGKAITGGVIGSIEPQLILVFKKTICKKAASKGK